MAQPDQMNLGKSTAIHRLYSLFFLELILTLTLAKRNDISAVVTYVALCLAATKGAFKGALCHTPR